METGLRLPRIIMLKALCGDWWWDWTEAVVNVFVINVFMLRYLLVGGICRSWCHTHTRPVMISRHREEHVLRWHNARNNLTQFVKMAVWLKVALKWARTSNRTATPAIHCNLRASLTEYQWMVHLWWRILSVIRSMTGPSKRTFAIGLVLLLLSEKIRCISLKLIWGTCVRPVYPPPLSIVTFLCEIEVYITKTYLGCLPGVSSPPLIRSTYQFQIIMVLYRVCDDWMAINQSCDTMGYITNHFCGSCMDPYSCIMMPHCKLFASFLIFLINTSIFCYYVTAQDINFYIYIE